MQYTTVPAVWQQPTCRAVRDPPYAKSKGDYQWRIDAITKLYENIEGADVNAELLADLVGDYIFTDSDFVSRLSTENRNLFQKIYDEIKYLCKVVTAGSKEARQLEQAKKVFAKVYSESGKQQTADETGNMKYSLSDTNNTEFSENGIDLYTEKQYNDYGWVRANDVMSAADYKKFNSYFADHKIHKHHYVKTRFGESIIPTGENSEILVYAKGTIKNP